VISEDQKGRKMGKVIVQASMSLDGFIADSNDQVGPLFDWYSNGDVEVSGSDPSMVFHTSAATVLIDLVPVVFGAGTRYFGDYDSSPLLLDDPEIVQGDRGNAPALSRPRVMIMPNTAHPLVVA
jgi:hypothetical protein